MTNKAELRKAMRKRRSELTRWEVEMLSKSAQMHILAEKVWRKARAVAIYVAVRHETGTALLAENAWSEGKELFVPYTPPSSDRDMYLLPCADVTALVPNHFGIPEPTPETCPLSPELDDAPQVIIVPGIVFDRKGHRIGGGAGYYDRFLARPSMKGALRIGFCYSFQVVNEPLPTDDWDIPMHALATEEGVTWL